MDGQLHSATHLDSLLDDKPLQVIVLMPTNRFTARAVGRQAERTLEAERTQLQAQGSEIIVCSPDEASAQRMGQNLMDPSNAGAAFEAGRADARAFAPRLLREP
jgi:hypothetical protein